MSKLHLILLLALTCALAACGDGNDRRQQPAPKIVVGKDNPWQKKMLAANETNRKLALRRAVQDDGGSCNKITGSRYQQDYQGMAMWVAYCSSGPQAVYLAPSGNVQVRPCRDAAALGLPECVPAPAAPDAPSWPSAADPVAPPPSTTE